MKTSLNEIKTRMEQFHQELERELYLEGAGLKDEANTAAIYERYADLSSASLLEFLRDEYSTVLDGPEAAWEKRKLRMTLESTTQANLGNSVKELNDRLLTTEASGIITVDGGSETMSFRSSAVALMNEPTRSRRSRISAGRDAFVLQKLNPTYEEMYNQTWESVSGLGYKNYVEMVQQLSGIDLFRLRAMTEEFLAKTEDMYVDVLGWFVGKKIGISATDLQKHDLTYLSRGNDFDEVFPDNEMVEKIFGFVRKMGIDPTAGGGIRLDVEPRAKKSPRAFCSTVCIPEEIYLVMMPAGGEDDYEAFLHELGHALHFGYTSPRLDWEFKRLGDNSVTEGFASTFDHLVMNRVWLKKVLEMRDAGDYLKHIHFIELMMLRRYCAKLAYELELHGDNTLNNKAQLYKKFLTTATKAEYSSEQYLADVDPFFYCARYLRAWMIESVLSQYLTEHFDEDWFLNPTAGEFLKELWQTGQKFTAEELARQLAYPSLTMDFMSDKLEMEFSR